MSRHKGAVIDDSMTYTQLSLAETLGRTPEWVVENIIDAGCYAKRLGNLYLVSGQSFRLWIENNASQATNTQRRSRGKQTVGREAEG